MKLLNKMIIALITLLCIGNISAYTWNFENKTDKTMVIRLRLQAHPYWYYNIVQPNALVSFDFKGILSIYCLDSFGWAEYDSNMKVTKVTQDGGRDLYMPDKTMLESKFDRIPYTYKEAQITYMDGSNVVTQDKDSFPKILGVAVMSLEDFIVRTPCQSRNFKIMKDDKGNIVFATPQ